MYIYEEKERKKKKKKKKKKKIKKKKQKMGKKRKNLVGYNQVQVFISSSQATRWVRVGLSGDRLKNRYGPRFANVVRWGADRTSGSGGGGGGRGGCFMEERGLFTYCFSSFPPLPFAEQSAYNLTCLYFCAL